MEISTFSVNNKHDMRAPHRHPHRCRCLRSASSFPVLRLPPTH